MWSQELEIAIDAARKAGSFLNGLSERKIVSEVGKDIKAEADGESESIIIDHLRLNSDYPILSEESYGTFDNDESQIFWIVDPIDGTLNFIRGIDLCCVSVALWKGKAPILGVVLDFNRNEIFHTIVGQDVFLNNVALQIPESKKISNSILGTGFPSYLKHDQETLLLYLEKIQRYKKIRLLGSAALSITYVAAGRIDAYYEKQIKLWDVAAGICFIESMGISYELKYLGDYSVELDIKNSTNDS